MTQTKVTPVEAIIEVAEEMANFDMSQMDNWPDYDCYKKDLSRHFKNIDWMSAGESQWREYYLIEIAERLHRGQLSFAEETLAKHAYLKECVRYGIRLSESFLPPDDAEDA